ncbi:MAG: hypothetical protein ACREDD_11330 [Methylocella sp.]
MAKIEADTASLKTDTAILKWMMGFVLAFQAAIFAKLFLLMARATPALPPSPRGDRDSHGCR